MKKFFILIILILTLSSSFQLSSAQISTSQIITTTTSQQFNQTTSILPITINPLKKSNGFGNDLGNIQTKFSPNGQFSMNNVYGNNLTISPISINGVQQTSNIVFSNSSTEKFNYGNVQVYFKQLQNGFNISITGFALINENISVQFFGITKGNIRPTLTGGIITNNDTHSLQFGNEVFDYSDSLNFNPSFNNVTDVLTWQINIGSFFIDPLALDSQAFCGVSETANNCVVSLVTTAPDLLYCSVGQEDASGTVQGSVSSITDNQGNGWTRRTQAQVLSGGFHQDGEGWYRIWSNFGTININVTMTSAANKNVEEVTCQGISGSQTINSPFDTNAGIPKTNTTTTGTSIDLKISTSQMNDYLTTMVWVPSGAPFGSPEPACSSFPAGFTYDGGAGGGPQGLAHKIVSATQSNLVVNWAWTGGTVNCVSSGSIMLFDAIKRALFVTLIVSPNNFGNITMAQTNTEIPFCTTITTIKCQVNASFQYDVFQFPAGSGSNLKGWQQFVNTSIDFFFTHNPTFPYQNAQRFTTAENNFTIQANYTNATTTTIDYSILYAFLILPFVAVIPILIKKKRRR